MKTIPRPLLMNRVKARMLSARFGLHFRLYGFALVVFIGVGISLGHAQQLLLSDSFDSASYGASTFNNTIATDQNGFVAPTAYTVTTGGQDWQAQHGNGSAMLLAGDSSYGSTASLNCNFALLANGANSPLQIKFDGWVDNTSVSSCWFSFAIGSAQNIYGHYGAAKFAILPTLGDGVQVWSSGSGIANVTRNTNSYTIILANTAGTGSAFNGNGSVVKLYNGTNLLDTYTLGQLGSGDGYISFAANPYNGSYNLAHFDNLSVSVSSIDALNHPTTYFVAASGDDGASGTNQSAPWKTLNKVNETTFEPGDQILFKTGDSWAGQLWPKGSGVAGAPIVLGSYGSGPQPVIDAQGAPNSAAIKLYNQEYWTIQNLTVGNWATNYGTRFGIWISADDGQIKHGFQILNNTVRDVYASAIRSPSTTDYPSFYSVGGIYINIQEPGRADTVLIQGNLVTNIVAQGICFWGESEFVGGGMNWNNLSPGVIVRSNVVSHTAGDGMLILGTDNELVEYNHVEYAGALGVQGTAYIAGMWPTRHRNGLWQFNEVNHAKRWEGDGQGFDNDLFVQGTTIFQYNYSHDNDGGFILDCCYPDGGQTVARYNISINEPLGHLLRNNAVFYNNVFYSPGRAITLTAGSGNLFANNVFWCGGLDSAFGSQLLVNNLYWGGTPKPAGDAHGILDSPGFLNPNTNGLLTGFQIVSNSPAIGSGIVVANNGGRDFFGAPVSTTKAPNRGVDNSPGAAYVPTATSLLISGPGYIQIPAVGVIGTNFIATVRDQYQLLISNAPVAWSLSPSFSGIELDPQTGALSVNSNAPILEPTVQAQSGSLTGTRSLVISPLLYQASGDYCATQGYRQWSYQYWTGSSYADMTWVPANNWWIGSETYLLLWSGGGHPGNAGDAVLKWTAPVPGVVRILGTVAKGDTSGGDGIVASIKQNTNAVWGPTAVAYDDTVGVPHDLTLTVQAGDALHFLINGGSNNGSDTTRWDPTIYYTVLLALPELSITSAGTNCEVRWPANHLGWTLIQQTNHLNQGISANSNDWMRLSGSSTTNQIRLPISFDQTCGFYKLVYP